LLSGDPASAAQAFQRGFDEIQGRLNNPSPGGSVEANRRYSETTYRLYAAQISILYARGLAEMELKRWGAAADTFERAALLARAQQGNNIVDVNTMDDFWFTVTTRDRRPMLSLSLADVWTNMLAARVRQHYAAVQAAANGGQDAIEEEARIREMLAARVAEAADHANEASEHPKLAANLIVAAARSGASTPAGEDDGPVAARSRFFVARAPTTGLAAVDGYADMLSNAGDATHASAGYWGAVQQWRKAMRGDGEPGVAAGAAIDERLARESGPERQQLQQWLCEVVEAEYRNAAPAQRREITRNYGRYYCGGGQRRYYDAAAPFGFIQGIILALLLGYAVLALWRGFSRTKAMYRRLFVPRHRVDRAKKTT
jgi:hypothetical protein